jgi:hypothetical protein
MVALRSTKAIAILRNMSQETETQNLGVASDAGDISDSSSSDDSLLSPSRETYLARLVSKFQGSLGQLGALDATDASDKVAYMSTFIYESMSNSARNYHFVQHVFDVIDGNVCASGTNTEPVLDAIAVLAALFHDCVYVNVDGCLSTWQRQKLHGAIVEETADSRGGPNVVVRTHPDSLRDPLLCMVLSIFGLKANQTLTPATGLNEYLSAVIAVRELEQLLSFKILVQIAVCIEATIPFRSVNEGGETPLDRLYSRLVQTVKTGSVDLTEQECVQAVQRAALVANEDVGNFGTTDHAWFLDNTWSLLPETNEALRGEHLYTVDQFLCAVFKMHCFFSFLKPGLIFQQFRGVPNSSTVDCLTVNAAQNLQVGSKYVAAKLVGVSFLASLAELSGGDVPISSFLGDLPSRKDRYSQLVENAQLTRPANWSDHCCPQVYRLLAKGRRKETSFDVRQSPGAAYLYACIGDDGLKRVLESVTTYPMTTDIARKFLTMLPRAAVAHLAEKITMVALSRKERILNVLRSLPCEHEEQGEKKGATK